MKNTNKKSNLYSKLSKTVKVINGDYKNESRIILSVCSKYVEPVYTLELYHRLIMSLKCWNRR